MQPYRLRAPFAKVLDVSQYDVVHDDGGFHVRGVLCPTAARGVSEQVCAAPTQGLEDTGSRATGRRRSRADHRA